MLLTASIAKALRVFLGRFTSEPDVAVLSFARVTTDGFVDTPPRVTGSVPLTGASLTYNITGSDELLRAVPAGTIAALTITFPTDALSRIGQTIGIVSTQTVTALTVTSSGLTLNGTAITALVANKPIFWQKTAASTWQRTNISDAASISGLVTSADLTASSSLDTLATNAGSNPTNAAAFNIAFFAGSGQTVGAKTTPSLTMTTGQTNTGFLQVLGKTSGGLKITTADATAQTVTVSAAAQTVGATTLTIPNFANVVDTFAFITLAQTLVNKTLTAPVLNGATSASGNFDLSGSSGTFLSPTGANTLGGAVTVADATTPSITTAAGKTNTGFLTINGKTSGGVKLTTADSSAFLLTINAAARTVGTATLTIPDTANVADTFAMVTLAQTLANKTLTAPVLGVATGTSVAVTGLLTSSGTAGIGYATGAGGTVVQATDKSTTAVLSKTCGAITMNNAQLNAGTIVSFTLTNTTIAATDVLVLNHLSGGTVGSYTLNAACGAGSATIYVRNNTAGNLSEAIVIQFAVVKGVNA